MAQEFSVELWQDGIMVASVHSPSKEDAERDIRHYAWQYAQDGPLLIRRWYTGFGGHGRKVPFPETT